MNIKTEYEADIGPTEMVFEIVDLPTPSKTISVWSNAETKQLIDLHKSLINEVGPQKRLMLKKDMWLEISTHFPNKTPKQCQERFKTVLKRKKNKFGKVYISEARRKTIDIDPKEDFENTFQIIRRPKIDYNKDDLTPFKNVSVWSNSETKQLMELYRLLICEVGPQKRFQHKKDMWAEISSHFSNKSPKQCEQRYNTVLKRKHKVFTLKERRKPVDLKPKDRFNSFQINRVPNIENDINSDDTEMEELNVQETFNVHLNKESNTHDKVEPVLQQNETINRQAKNDLTLHELLLDIATKREEAKERRHREKLEAINKMQNILQLLLDLKKNENNLITH